MHRRQDLWGLLSQLIGKSSLRYSSGTFLIMTSCKRRQSNCSLLMAKLSQTRNLRRSADLVSYACEVIMWAALFWYFWILLASPLFRLPQTALQWSKTGWQYVRYTCNMIHLRFNVQELRIYHEFWPSSINSFCISSITERISSSEVSSGPSTSIWKIMPYFWLVRIKTEYRPSHMTSLLPCWCHKPVLKYYLWELIWELGMSSFVTINLHGLIIATFVANRLNFR